MFIKKAHTDAHRYITMIIKIKYWIKIKSWNIMPAGKKQQACKIAMPCDGLTRLDCSQHKLQHIPYT